MNQKHHKLAKEAAGITGAFGPQSLDCLRIMPFRGSLDDYSATFKRCQNAGFIELGKVTCSSGLVMEITAAGKTALAKYDETMKAIREKGLKKYQTEKQND